MVEQDEEMKYLPSWNVPLTIWWDEKKKVVKLIDQTLLPDEVVVIECDNWRCIEEAISILRIRGAPALGVAGAYALALEAQRFEGDEEGFFKKMNEVNTISTTRPTAVNLRRAVDEVYKKLEENRGKGIEKLKEIALEKAEKIIEKGIETNKDIGKHGLEIFKKSRPKDGNTFKILTHCHAGSLATEGYGTVFGVIRTAIREGINLHVFVDETRPLLQGARITAWELKLENIPFTLITDNSAAWIIKKEEIDMVIVGADRIAANGDTANKIGTYSLSILAKEHKIPFYVAAPISTIDMETTCGEEIEIERRGHEEVVKFSNSIVNPFLGKDQVLNYAFDVTPHNNITGIITEAKIIHEPYKEAIAVL